MDIDESKLNKEITDKYAVISNSFKLDKIKNAELDQIGEPKDEINVEVGDTKQVDFLPQVKLCRFSNEVNFSIRLKDEDTINTATVSTDKDKIVWEKGNIKIENYDFTEDEGGYKFVWYLKEKPLTNKVEFTIQSKGLDFFYQPELTAEEIAQGASRPENVVGSYAVYHQTKGGMNDSAGKEYKTWQAFFIYRPHIIDASGAETWGILKIENGIYSVEIPQDFLDKAVYPIKSNDTFGYTTAGGSFGNGLGKTTYLKAIAASAGNLSKLSAYIVWNNAGSGNFYTGVYSDSSGANSKLATAATITISNAAAAWYDGTITLAITATTYHLAESDGVGSASYRWYYNTGSNGDSNDDTTYTVLPATASLAGTLINRLWSIYATYTASGGGAATIPVPTLAFMGAG